MHEQEVDVGVVVQLVCAPLAHGYHRKWHLLEDRVLVTQRDDGSGEGIGDDLVHPLRELSHSVLEVDLPGELAAGDLHECRPEASARRTGSLVQQPRVLGEMSR